MNYLQHVFKSVVPFIILLLLLGACTQKDKEPLTNVALDCNTSKTINGLTDENILLYIKCLDELVKDKYLSNYSLLLDDVVPDFTFSCMDFYQNDVEISQAEIVKEELVKKAETHYEKVTQNLERKDLKEVLGYTDIYMVNFKLNCSFDEKIFYVEVNAYNPLIHNKNWRRTNPNCPIQDIRWKTNSTGSITLDNWDSEHFQKFIRYNSSFLIITEEKMYTFKIKELNRIQLVQIEIIATSTKIDTSYQEYYFE